MKMTKTEKIWLILVIVFYAAYNLPFVPPYHSAAGAIIHGLVTLIPLWICVYVGLTKVCRIYKLKENTDLQSEKQIEKQGKNQSVE